MALLSATGVRADPVLNHNFVVSLIDTTQHARRPRRARRRRRSSTSPSAASASARASRCRCSPRSTRRAAATAPCSSFPSRVTWTNLTLKKGIGVGTALWDWHYGFVEGRGKRRDGVDRAARTTRTLPSNIWYFRRGLPVKYTGPSLNATQNNVAIESIEIAHEGIHQVPASAAAAPPSARSRDWWVSRWTSRSANVTSTVRAVDGDALLSPQVHAGDRRAR